MREMDMKKVRHMYIVDIKQVSNKQKAGKQWIGTGKQQILDGEAIIQRRLSSKRKKKDRQTDRRRPREETDRQRQTQREAEVHRIKTQRNGHEQNKVCS